MTATINHPYWPSDCDWENAWQHNPFKCDPPEALADLYPNGMRIRFGEGHPFGLIPEGFETTLYWVTITGDTSKLRFSFVDQLLTLPRDEREAWQADIVPDAHRGVTPLVGRHYDDIGNLRGILPTNGAPLPKPQYKWPTAELGTLVRLHPRAELTRALLRRIFNQPPPADAADAEALAEWARELTPVLKISGRPYVAPARQTNRDERTIDVDVTLEGEDYGTVSYTETWRRSGTVSVPFHVFAEGEDAVREYCLEEARDFSTDYMDTNYGDPEFEDSEEGDFEGDFDEAMQEYEEIIREEAEEEEDED